MSRVKLSARRSTGGPARNIPQRRRGLTIKEANRKLSQFIGSVELENGETFKHIANILLFKDFIIGPIHDFNIRFLPTDNVIKWIANRLGVRIGDLVNIDAFESILHLSEIDNRSIIGRFQPNSTQLTLERFGDSVRSSSSVNRVVWSLKSDNNDNWEIDDVPIFNKVHHFHYRNEFGKDKDFYFYGIDGLLSTNEITTELLN